MAESGAGERGARLVAQLEDLALELRVPGGAVALRQLCDLGEQGLGIALGNGR